MKTKPLKNKIMFITTIIFGFLTLFFNIYLYYVKSKEQEFRYLEKEKNLKSLLVHIEKNLTYSITSRLETITKFDYFQDFKKDLQNNTFLYKNTYADNLEFNFTNLKIQTPAIKTFHITDTRGYSYIRMHDKNLYEDKGSDLRSSIAEIIQNPKDRSYFEYGICGLKYRISHPIYNNEQFLGFIEVGVEPTYFALAMKELSSYESFVFIKEKSTDNFHTSVIIDKELNESFKHNSSTHIHVNNKTYAKYEFILEDIEGAPVVKIITLEDISESQKLFFNFFLISILISIILMFLLLAILDRFFNKILSRMDELLYLINHTDDFIIAIDAVTKKIKFANAPVYNLLNLKEHQLKSFAIENLLLPIEKENNYTHSFFEFKGQKAVTKRAYLYVNKEHSIPLEMSINYIQKDGGYFVVIAKNISSQLELELEKRVNEWMINKYIPMSHTDLNGIITYVNEAFCNLSGYSKEELLGSNHSILKSLKTPPEIYDAMWKTISVDKTFRTELRILRKDGTEIWVKILIEPRYDIHANKIGYISTREDVTDKQKLKFVSEHDPLTKAYNRRSFESKLAQMLESSYKYNKSFGLIMFDIDHFKKVNDTHGHQVGDEVLIKLSNILQKTIRENDFFARWGGE
ncbi:MAG: diguanylate cyclase, partial [Sulfurimonadaceae bacterium]|nr:diguanylate cyclase [Sulfurimonadaceae bacterium]